VDLENQGTVHFADDIALVRLDEDADSDQVEQSALARDLEGAALWLVDVRALSALAGYGDALKVLWCSDELLVADDAAA
jgi:hypothetical protein